MLKLASPLLLQVQASVAVVCHTTETAGLTCVCVSEEKVLQVFTQASHELRSEHQFFCRLDGLSWNLSSCRMNGMLVSPSGMWSHVELPWRP